MIIFSVVFFIVVLALMFHVYKTDSCCALCKHFIYRNMICVLTGKQKKYQSWCWRFKRDFWR